MAEMTVWEKVEKWVAENPDGYLEYTHQQIGHDKDKRSVADISYITKCCEATVRKYLRRD